ncbi:hypothetical protein BU23DRAFT_556963 [Bimuria novae-zelandiae CBS 107.79]|uniref:Uncharacterized protein n=1 Tax=Bimuria novae-zelandiae CBS 107.79 TaxID=1447943 RepID=A0A6A5V224_9PLEO|nr:hypothetical protein BU23DRAFT_556963 [Bimuria novae-zelandiae CBS 107.79]
MAPPRPDSRKIRLAYISPSIGALSPEEEIKAVSVPSPRSDSTKTTSTFPITLENLPVEVINHILSYLLHPHSRLPGLSEHESALSPSLQRPIKDTEDLTSPPDTFRFAADLFAWTHLPHPFNALAATSKHCRALVESYSSHLVKTCNHFNLPFAQADQHGAITVHPRLDSIIYRRLWLQTAPRRCLFCLATLSNYPHRGFGLLLACADCFYAQALTLHEVMHQYHMDAETLAAHGVRASNAGFDWILRVYVEALALKLYGTRAFHDTRSEGLDRPCSIPRCGLAGENVSASSPPRVEKLPTHVTRTRRCGR